MNCQNVNEAWFNFKSLFTGVLDEITPIKQIRIKSRTEPWMCSNILDLIRQRDKALHISNKNKENEELRNNFNSLRNKVQRKIKKAKSSYFKNKIKENKKNPKELWRQFKTLGYSNKNNENSKVILNIDKEICFDPLKVAQYINDYFLNVAKQLVS